MKGNVTLEEKQKAYVKDSLIRAIREMKVAKIECRKLQSVDGTLMWSHLRNNYKAYFL